jgi:hypothetical protein
VPQRHKAATCLACAPMWLVIVSPLASGAVLACIVLESWHFEEKGDQRQPDGELWNGGLEEAKCRQSQQQRPEVLQNDSPSVHQGLPLQDATGTPDALHTMQQRRGTRDSTQKVSFRWPGQCTACVSPNLGLAHALHPHAGQFARKPC